MRDIKHRVKKLERRQAAPSDFLFVRVQAGESDPEAFLRTCHEKSKPPKTIKKIARFPADVTEEEWEAEYGQ